MPTTDHPTDAALAAPDASVGIHIANCERCRIRQRSTTTPPVPVPPVEVSLPAAHAPERLVEAMRGLPHFEDAPAPGQMWRLEFDGTAAPAVVAEVTEEALVVWAVGEDIEFADAATVLVDDSLLGIGLGVWTSLEFAVPRFTAERRLADLEPATFDELVSVRDRMLHNEPPIGAGAAFTSDLDPRLAYRDQLAAPFTAFTQLAQDLVSNQASRRSLRPLLDEAGLRPAALSELGFAPDELQALSRDQLWLDDEEVVRIAIAAEQPTEYVVAHTPQPPLDLVVALHRPQHRTQVARDAAKRSIPEVVARREATRGVWAQQRRTTGRGEPDWDAAIDSYFAGR